MATPISREGLIAGMSSLAPQQNQQAAASVGASSQLQQTQQAAGQFLASGGQTMGKPQQQAAATQTAAQKGQAALGAAQSTVQQQQQIGQLGLAEQQRQQQAQLGEKKLNLQKKQRELENGIASLGEEVKTKLFDKQLQFQHDELGMTQFTERNLLDWKVQKAKSMQELYAYQQQVSQMTQRKVQYIKAAHAKVVQELEQRTKDKMLSADQATQEKLLRAKLSLESQLTAEQNAAKNRAAMLGAAMKMGPMNALATAVPLAIGAKALGMGDNPVNQTVGGLAQSVPGGNAVSGMF